MIVLCCNCARKALCGHLSILSCSRSSVNPRSILSWGLHSAHMVLGGSCVETGTLQSVLAGWNDANTELCLLLVVFAFCCCVRDHDPAFCPWCSHLGFKPVNIHQFTAVWSSSPPCGPVHRRVDQFTALPFTKKSSVKVRPSPTCLLLAVFDLIAVAVTVI